MHLNFLILITKSNHISGCKILQNTKSSSFLFWLKKKKTYINGCKIVHKCKNATVTMHICTVTVALYLIFYFFFLTPSPHSLFLSLVPHSHSLIFEASRATDLQSKLTVAVPPPIVVKAPSLMRSSKLTCQSSSCATTNRCRSSSS